MEILITIGISCLATATTITMWVQARKYKKLYKEEKASYGVINNGEDRLTQLFTMQKELQKNFYKGELPDDSPEMLANNVLCLVAELGEVLQADKRWKDWCKNPPKPDFDEKKEEIVDCFHFAINLCLYSGMSEDDLYKHFTKKNKVNKDRQKNNY